MVIIMSRVRSWYKNKTEVSNCGKCFYWCNVKECELEQQYRKLNKIVPASHAPCENIDAIKES